MFERLKDESYYRRFYFQDSFFAQCMDVDGLTLEQFDRSAENARRLVAENPIFKTAGHVISAGCGDSNLVSFALKGAFEHYLPEVEFEAVEAAELARHYAFGPDGGETIGLFVSFSGQVLRTIEALRQCANHGVTTVAVTDGASSDTAKEADLLYHTNTPRGDNNAGLRTYYSNVISGIILAAAMAETRTGKALLPGLREQVAALHDRFFSEIEAISDTCFRTAIHWMDKRVLEVVADGPLFWAGKFIQAKVVELSGDPCSVVDSATYRAVNRHMAPAGEVGTLVLLNSADGNAPQMAAAVNAMADQGREVLLFSDADPGALGITGAAGWCHMALPGGEWAFLAPIYAYLPGAIFAGFRHTTIGEPMFRGGMDKLIFSAAYFSPIVVPRKDGEAEGEIAPNFVV